MGLHLGWIPNEPGLRPREFARRVPGAAGPDPLRMAALRAAHAARALWTRLLVVVGAFTLALFGVEGSFAHVAWAWGAGAGIAACCWLPVAELAWSRRRAGVRLRSEMLAGASQDAAELAAYEQRKAQWDASEAERIAVTPRWLRVGAHADIDRLDVFGGTARGRQNLLTGVGQALLEHRAVVVVDLSQDRVCEGLIEAAYQSGISYQDYQLPRDLPSTPLLAGLSGDQVASLIVEVLHADDTNATAAGRATDLMLLRKIIRVLGDHATMSRLYEALSLLLGNVPDVPQNPDARDDLNLTAGERACLHGLFGSGLRGDVAGNLVRLAAVVEPLAGLGTDAAFRPAARLTCLSLPDGPRDVTADLAAALIVQWATRSIADDGGFRPAVLLAGAHEQSTRHLGRLTTVCERYQVPLVRTFARLTEESALHLDTRHTAFMRLPTRPEAMRAAEHIGLERRFVAGHFSHSHSVSRSRTKTTGESVTHGTGSSQGGAVTQAKGSTTGQSYSEAEVPRRDSSVHVSVGDRGAGDRGAGNGGAGNGGSKRPADQAKASGGRPGASVGGREPAPGAHGRKPEVDVVKTRTRFTAQHESEAKTQSWTKTEETSHTRSNSRSRTDGTSVGDEITYELVYDHRVAPETLMALPEDQMLAPSIVSGAGAGKAFSGSRVPAESRMVALVIDPSLVGSDAVVQVLPDEIPAYEPPTPAVSSRVPDYERLPAQPR